MSIQDEINRINNNVQTTLQTIADTGVTVGANSDALPAAAAALANEKAPVNHSHLYYGVCGTAAATAAKTVTVDGFELVTGAMVIVKFTYANSVESPTLNVNGTGAKPIRRYGTTAASTGTTTSGWIAGAVQLFVYDGSGWVRDYWNNTTYSNVSLGQGYATCTTAAATVAKVGTLSSYALVAGGVVAVKFTYAVPASATLNINSKGAKAIYFRGAAITADVIKAGDTATFIYNGSQYHLLSIDRWQTDIADHDHTASEVTFSDGQTFQQKYDAGALTGPTGPTGPQGPAGPYFTPAVSSDGVLSWSNNGGLANPASFDFGSFVGGGSTVVTGTYRGDMAASRTISTGVSGTPKFVFISIMEYIQYMGPWFKMPGLTMAFGQTSGGTMRGRINTSYGTVDGGFTVGNMDTYTYATNIGVSTNYGDVTYKYVAVY